MNVLNTGILTITKFTPFTQRKMSSRSGIEKAQFHNFETRLQYRDTQPLPFLVENHMLDDKVGDIKRGLLSLDMLAFVKEKPEELKMYLVLPANDPTHDKVLQAMDDKCKLREYLTELGCCEMLKLLRPRDLGVQQRQ